jgi:EmrB/QacA subfamily drug resistance transporter
MAAAHAPVVVEETSLSKPRIQASPWIVLIVLALGEFMILLDTTIVAVAVPSLAGDLNATLDQVLWVLNAYTLIFAVLLITAGRLGDMFGPKRMFLTGLAIFTVSSAACGLAQSPVQLIIFRSVQAVGAASLMPQTLSIVTSIFPPEKRGAAFGAWGAVAGVAAVAGPTLGGILTSAFSWRAVFFPNVPIGIAAIILAALMMPEMTLHRKRRLDMPGVLLATTALVALVYAVIEGEKYSWGRINGWLAFDLGPIHAGLVSVPSLFAFSALILAVFLLWESRQEEPLLPLSLFRDRNYSLGITIQLMVDFAILGFFLPLTLFLQTVLGLTAFQSGIVIFPNALAIVITAPIAGQLSDKLNAKYLLTVGLIIFGVALFLVGHVASLSASGWTFAVPLFMTGLGLGLTFAPMTSEAMRNILPTAAGAASGFLNTIRQIGAALGSAVVGAVLANQLAVNIKSQAHHFAQQLPAQDRAGFLKAASGSSSGGLEVGRGQSKLSVPPGLPASVAHHMATLGQLAYNHGFLDALRPAIWVSIPLIAVSVLLTLFMRGRKAPAVSVESPAIPPISLPETAVPPGSVVAPLGVTGTVMVPMTLARRRHAGATPPIQLPYLERVAEPGVQHPVEDRPVMIGRLAGSDVTLDNPNVSRQHALIHSEDGRMLLRDLGSANGTYLNGERIAGEQALHDGDIIGVGNDALVFHNDIERARPRLVAVSDGNEEVPIYRAMTVGRAKGSDIVINDPSASRHHAEVLLEGGDILVRDLETLNGTYINGQPIAGEAAIAPGDIVVFGSTPFLYRNELAATA